MSAAHDVRIALQEHEIQLDEHAARLDALEPSVSDSQRRLDGHDRKFEEHEGYLAMLDRAHQSIGEQIERLQYVNSELGKVIGQLRRGQNGQ